MLNHLPDILRFLLQHILKTRQLNSHGMDDAAPQVEFCVQSSRGPDSRICVSRAVAVTPACPPEEILCEDSIECSVDGVCPIDLLGGVLAAEAKGAVSTSEEDAKRAPSPPRLHLLGSNAVALKRGTKYRKCGPQEDLDAGGAGAAPCDEGAVCGTPNSAVSLREVLQEETILSEF